MEAILNPARGITEAVHYSVHCIEVRHLYQRPYTTVYTVHRSGISIRGLTLQCTLYRGQASLYQRPYSVQRSSILIPEAVHVYRGQASLYQRTYSVQRSSIFIPEAIQCTLYRGQASLYQRPYSVQRSSILIPEAVHNSVHCTEVRHLYQRLFSVQRSGIYTRGRTMYRGQAYLPERLQRAQRSGILYLP